MALQLSFSSILHSRTPPTVHRNRRQVIANFTPEPSKNTCPFASRVHKSEAPVTSQVTAALEPPPGPWKLPIIGSMHHLISSYPHRRLRDLAESYGPVMLLRLGEFDVAVISSREAAREVMKKQDLNFINRPELAAAKLLTYNCTNIAFAPYSPYWRQLRHLCLVELLSPKRVKSFASLRIEETMKLMTDIKNSSLSSPGKPVELGHMIVGMANGIVSRSSFGHKCRDQDKFMEAMDSVMKLASGFAVAELFPSLKFLDIVSGFSSKIEKLHSELDEILDATIIEHQLSRVEGEDEDLIDILLRLKDQGDLEVPITIDNIKAVLIDMFTAGTETSSSTIEWVMTDLIRHPKIMKKAQEEIRQVMEGKTSIEEADLSKLNYLSSIIKETLRLHTPVPLLLPRECKETCQVLGYRIEAGTRVIINAWALAHDPKYWEDPNSFKPERFEDSLTDFKGNNFEYVPFGAGRRICPGMSFALSSVELGLAHLLHYFDWKLPNGMEINDLDMAENNGFTAAKKSKLQLLAIPRNPLPTL